MTVREYFVCLSFSFHLSFFLIPTLKTDYKWVEIIHIYMYFLYFTAEGIVSYQNVPYCLAEITMGLF